MYSNLAPVPLFSDLPTPEEMQQWDAQAIETYKIPDFTLMENAAREAFHVVQEQYPDARKILILMGGGNNGGDGAALARHLHEAGRQVLVCHTKALGGMKKAARAHSLLAVKCGVPFARLTHSPTGLSISPSHKHFFHMPDLIVDSLLGTGFTQQLRPFEALCVAHINSLRDSCPVLALDVPSGLNALTGVPCPQAVMAQLTVTFEAAKVGLCLPEAAPYVGRLLIRPIGIPRAIRRELPPSFQLISFSPSALPAPSPLLHKGSAGRVIIIGGSPGMDGAPVLAGLGALRAGAGLVSLLHPGGLNLHSRTCWPELMTIPLGTSEHWSPESIALISQILTALPAKSAVVLGPGLGRSSHAAQLVKVILEEARRPPVVLDADGLFPLGNWPEAEWRRALRPGDIITPHPGEMAQLLGLGNDDIQRDRPAALTTLWRRCAATIVLKGAGTLIGQQGQGGTPPPPIALSPVATGALAVGGSGDVLAGICGALLAYGYDSYNAAALGVAIHGAAGEMLARRYPRRGVLARQIAEVLPELWGL